MVIDSVHRRPYIKTAVKAWIHAANLEIVPISPYITGAEAAAIFDHIDGLFIHPGIAGEHMDSIVDNMANTLLTMACSAAKSGRHFPVWGTCYGFEKIVEFIGKIDHLDALASKDYFTRLRWKGRLMHHVPYFDHTVGISVQRFVDNARLRNTFNILGVATDRMGKDYVAFIEGRRLPWYGCQFHPEIHGDDFWTDELRRKMTTRP